MSTHKSTQDDHEPLERWNPQEEEEKVVETSDYKQTQDSNKRCGLETEESMLPPRKRARLEKIDESDITNSDSRHEKKKKNKRKNKRKSKSKSKSKSNSKSKSKSKSKEEHNGSENESAMMDLTNTEHATDKKSKNKNENDSEDDLRCMDAFEKFTFEGIGGNLLRQMGWQGGYRELGKHPMMRTIDGQAHSARFGKDHTGLGFGSYNVANYNAANYNDVNYNNKNQNDNVVDLSDNSSIDDNNDNNVNRKDKSKSNDICIVQPSGINGISRKKALKRKNDSLLQSKLHGMSVKPSILREMKIVLSKQGQKTEEFCKKQVCQSFDKEKLATFAVPIVNLLDTDASDSDSTNTNENENENIKRKSKSKTKKKSKKKSKKRKNSENERENSNDSEKNEKNSLCKDKNDYLYESTGICGISKEVVSLIDCYSQLRIRIPVKGEKCSHIQPFDLESFVRRPLKYRKCAICNCEIERDDLYVDMYFQKIINQIETNDEIDIENCDKIVVFSSGDWEPIICSNEKNNNNKKEKREKKEKIEENEGKDKTKTKTKERERSSSVEIVDIIESDNENDNENGRTNMEKQSKWRSKSITVIDISDSESEFELKTAKMQRFGSLHSSPLLSPAAAVARMHAEHAEHAEHADHGNDENNVIDLLLSDSDMEIESGNEDDDIQCSNNNDNCNNHETSATSQTQIVNAMELMENEQIKSNMENGIENGNNSNNETSKKEKSKEKIEEIIIPATVMSSVDDIIVSAPLSETQYVAPIESMDVVDTPLDVANAMSA